MADKIWASFWIIIVPCATITIICCVYYHAKIEMKYIEAGYTKQSFRVFGVEE